MLDTVQQRNSRLAAIERLRNSSVIAYMLHDNAMIADDAIPQIYDKLQAWGRRERIDLLLHARSGAGEAVWRVLNLLREGCDHLGVIVGTKAQGTAALLALGADEIVVGPLSDLGSVESARKHPLLPRDDLNQPLPTTWHELEWLLEASGSGERPIPDALYQYIHPLAIAQLREANLLNRELTRKALGMHMPESGDRIDKIADLFNGGFHSALYTPSAAELGEMGLPVTQADSNLWRPVWEAAQLYQTAIYSEHPDAGNPLALTRYVCIIETVGRTTGLRQTFAQLEGGERVLQISWETAIKGPNTNHL